ncbi:phosphodiesterase [Aliagarivorans taiwanensis]|uniref:phosphodiesterase n=1 Tax=Aliagarivorans taiwanensis TaxID=561966 RepID=UPI0003F4D963|nr:phosphodiesterase [Aliagarivorans taiwanensis]
MYFVCSDIHGDAAALKLALERFDQSGARYLLSLGDLLNHGPRNPLPEHYRPLECAEMLNRYRKQIIAVRGNCDSEVDQALCEFPILSEYNQLLVGERRLFCCHGHTYKADKLPPLSEGDVFASGHTHVPVAEKQQSLYLFNPGSISMPRQQWAASYGLIDEQGMRVCSLEDGSELLSCAF